MILQDLCRHYDLLSGDPRCGIPPRYYSSAPVSYVFELSADGRLLAVFPLYNMEGKRRIVERLIVPEQVVRTQKPLANFLCDNSGYVLGVDDKGNPDRSMETFRAFQQLHEEVLRGVRDPGAIALLDFLRSHNPDDCTALPLQDYLPDLLKGGNIVFRLSGDEGYLHQRKALREVWERYRMENQSGTQAQCLVTGTIAPIASVHPSVKGVVGAQSTGAAIVSFNADAYCSYGKEQSLNAPVSEEAAFKYTTALNYLLSSKRNSMLLGDSTVVFWAERLGKEVSLLAELMGVGQGIEGEGTDEGTTQLLRDTLQRMRNGQPITALELDQDVRIHILGLAPNAARLSVRFYQTSSFGTLLRRFMQHHDDMQIVQDSQSVWVFPPLWKLMAETAVGGKRENVPNTLISSTMKAILEATPYPHGLYHAILMRIRAEREINGTRAGIIKGCLIRWQRRDGVEKEEYTVALNEESVQKGYLLGRLFALLEKAQLNAQGSGLNRTIRASYFSSASATPATVFPQLLRLGQYHISKSDSNNWIDHEIGKVLDNLAVESDGSSNRWGFPSTLSLKEQGLFMLGYYQQRQDFYRPRKNTGEEKKEEK
ncbi:MAG: type I-C CRISPR-associated protein Cas8c/Csd1 [Bacillota bacterium]